MMTNIIFFIFGFVAKYILELIHGLMIIKNLSEKEREELGKMFRGKEND